MPASEARDRLAAMQARLVRSLVSREPPPPCFDAARLRAAADALATKRARAVGQAWPALSQALGTSFQERFAAYADATPLPGWGGPLADGRAFARLLAQGGKLPDAGRIEALRVDLRFRQCGKGLRARQGPALLWDFLPGTRRLLIAARLPWYGELWLSLPLGFLTRRRTRRR